MARSDIENVDTWEQRPDRPYDEQGASGLLHPNGTQVASFDRAFLGAAGREVLALHDQQREADNA